MAMPIDDDGPWSMFQGQDETMPAETPAAASPAPAVDGPWTLFQSPVDPISVAVAAPKPVMPKPAKLGGPAFQPDVEAAIDAASQQFGVDPSMLRAFAKVESGGDPRNRTGSYKGLFQLSDDEFGRHGGSGDIFDPGANARAAAVKIKTETEQFRKKYGRDPSASELYLIHQQGPGGADAHWTNPDAPAWENMYRTAEGRQKGPAWARQAIWGNLPDADKKRFGNVDNVTSRDFAKLWDDRVGRLAGGPGMPQDAAAPAGQDPADPLARILSLPREQQADAFREHLTGLGITVPKKPVQVAQAQGPTMTDGPWTMFQGGDRPADKTEKDDKPGVWERTKDILHGLIPGKPIGVGDAVNKFLNLEINKGLVGSLVGGNSKGFGDALEGFGQILESDGLIKRGAVISKWGKGELEKYKARVPSFVDIQTDSALSFLADLGSYAGYQTGNAVGSSVPSLATGLAAGAISRNPQIAIFVGAFGPSYIQNYGDVYGSSRDDDGIKKRIAAGELTQKEVATYTAMAAVPMAALDAWGVEQVLGKTLFAEAKKDLKRRIISGIAKGAVAEGPTEAVQEIISQWAQHYLGSETTLKEKFISIGDNFFGGLLGGGAMGGVGAAVRRRAPVTKPGEEPPPIPGQPGDALQPPPIPGQPGTVAQEPPPLPLSGPAPSPAEMFVLQKMNYTPEDIGDMTPEQRAAEVEDARSMGITAPADLSTQSPRVLPDIEDEPTREPLADIIAQARDLADPKNDRQGLYLSADNVANLQQNPDWINQIAESLRTSGDLVEDIDGNGGLLLTKDKAVSDAARQAIAAGIDPQAVLGVLTGAGNGKPVDGSAVVQQTTPAGAVTRESVVRPGEEQAVAEAFKAPGRDVRTVSPQEAVTRREAETAAPAPQNGDGSRQAPVKVATPEDIVRAGERVAEPTDGQKDAGNYRKGHASVAGLDITIENPKGSVRRGKSPDGSSWEVTMPAAYGYFKRSKGKDGDQVDAYVGDNPQSPYVFVIDQVDPATGKFDEHKVMLGFDGLQEALHTYGQAFSDGRGGERVGGVTEMSVDEFRSWLSKGRRTRPVSDLGVKPDTATVEDAETVAEKPDNKPGTYQGEPLTAGEIETVVKAWRYVNAIEEAIAAGKQVQPRRIEIANELDADLSDYGVSIDDFQSEDAVRQYLGGGRDDVATGSERPESTQAPSGQDQTDGRRDRDEETGSVAPVEARPPKKSALGTKLEDMADRDMGGRDAVDRVSGKQTDLVDMAKAEPKKADPYTTGKDVARDYVLTKGRAANLEFGMMVLEDGTTKENKSSAISTKSFLEVSEETAPDLYFGDPKSVDFHHNHPKSTSFSRSDYTHAAPRKALRRTWVHGHDGSEYWATLNADADSLGRAFDLAQAATDALAVRQKIGKPEGHYRYAGHMRALMMQEAGIIGYGATLAPEDASERVKAFRDAIGASKWKATVASIKEIVDGLYDRRPGDQRTVAGVGRSLEVSSDARPVPPGSEAVDPTGAARDRGEEGGKVDPLVAIGDKILEDGFKTIVEARKFARDLGIEGDNKAIDEVIETAVVGTASRLAQNPATPPKNVYRMLVNLYNNQPNLATRTGTSVANQAYSTPVPLAYLASRLADVAASDSVYEPTAGNGALLLEVVAKGKAVVNELDPRRASALRAQGFKVTENDGALPPKAKDIDSVIMNPPFGAVKAGGKSTTFKVGDWSTTQIDHAVALNGLEAMAEDGKAVLILGGTKSEDVKERRKDYRGKAKREFYYRLYNQYNVVDHFTVSGDLYSKQGASWPVDVIVIDGRGKSKRELPAANPPAILKSWDQLAEKLPDAAGREELASRPVDKPSRSTSERGTETARDDAGAQPATNRGGSEPAQPRTEGKPGAVRADRDQGQPADVGSRERPDAAQSRSDRDGGRTGDKADPKPIRPRIKQERKEGASQAAYEPASNAKSLDTLIPVNMADAARNAIERVAERHGSIDTYVAKQLGYKPGSNEFAAAFSAEQVDALASAIDNVERGAAFIIGDQCVAGHTRVYDPITGSHAQIKDLARQGRPIRVLSLTPDGFTVASATAPFRKGEADLYRVRLDDDREITVTRQHRFLTASGWKTLDDGLRAGHFLASAEGQPANSLASVRSTRHANVARSTDTPASSMDDCSAYCHPCGAQPRVSQGSAQGASPSPADVLRRIQSAWLAGDLGTSRERNHLRPDCGPLARSSSSHPSTRVPSRTCIEERASRASASTLTHQNALQSRGGETGLHPATAGVRPHQHADVEAYSAQTACAAEVPHRGQLSWHDSSSRSVDERCSQRAHRSNMPSKSLREAPQTDVQCDFPLGSYTGWRRIVSIDFVGREQFFDMWVPGFENYVAEGVVNHNTGIGKGRIAAGMLRYAMQKGMVPVFVTEKPDLYGDMFRDLRDIGVPEMLGRDVRMFITNAGETVALDEEAVDWKNEYEVAKANGEPLPKRRGQFLTGGTAAKVANGMARIANGEDVADVVFTTYDQMNTVKGQTTARRQFLAQVAPGAMMVFDESHNAGGATKTGWEKKDATPNRADFARDLAAKAKGVMFSSATYAKRPDVMDLYARTDMGKAVDDAKDLPELIQRGGVPMQQIVASMLSESGQYMRRERSFDGVEYALEPVPVDINAYKQFSSSMQAIFRFDLAVEEFRKEWGNDALDSRGMAKAKDSGVGGGSANSTSFGALMHNITNQMLLAIKAEQTAQRAIKAHKAGEKPVIALANTNESFIKDFADSEGLEIGQALDLDFSAVLGRYLNRTLRVTLTHPDGKKKEHLQIPVDDLPTSLRQEFRAAQNLVREGDYKSLPISPIDWIRYRLSEAGMSVKEVTGRQTMIDYSQPAPKYIIRPKAEQGASGKRGSIAYFNSGRLDALILNRSGSTGVSMHASEKFKDRRKRRMILAQAEGNIDTHLQMLGRVHRTGQVIPPAYSQIAAEIPAEARPTAVLMKKMASLNANTTGARSSAFTVESVDFINEVGDKVVADLLIEDADLNVMLGEPLKYDEAGKAKIEDVARKATGRLVLLDPDVQARFLDQIQKAYQAEVEQLDALGENPLEAKTVDIQAKVLDTTELKPKQGDSPFLDSVRIEKVSAKAQGRAMPTSEVASKVAEFLKTDKPTGDDAVALAALEAKGRAWKDAEVDRLTKLMRQQIASEVADTGADSKESVRRRLDAQLARWQATMGLVYPGARVTLGMPAGDLNGVVMSVERTGKAKQMTAAGSWTVKIAVPDSMRVLEFPMSKLFPPSVTKSDDEKGATIARSGASHTDLVEQFEQARKEGRETRYIVTGNILGGYDQTRGRGRIVNYTTEDGNIRPGILMGREFEVTKFMDTRRVRFQTGAQIATFLDRVPLTEVTSKAGEITLAVYRGEYRIEMAGSRQKAGQFFTDRDVLKALAPKDFAKRGNKMIVDGLSRAQFVRAVDKLKDIGGAFETNNNQDEAQEIIAGGMREEADQEDFPRVNKDGYVLALPYEKEWGNPRFIKADRERAIARLREIQSINADDAPWADLVQAKKDIDQITTNLFYWDPEQVEKWDKQNARATSYDIWQYIDETLNPETFALDQANHGMRHSLFSDKNIPADLAEFADEGGQALDSLLDSRRKGLRELLTYGDETDPVKPKKERPVGAIGDKMPSGFYFKAARKIDAARDDLFRMGGQSVINWLMKEGVSRAEINHFRLQEKFGTDAPTTRDAFKQAIGERIFDFRRKMSWLNPERSKRDYELGGTRAFTGPRVPGQGIYFERPIAFPKRLAGGAQFPPGQFESPHWYDVLQNAWASWRGSIREVPGFGKMLVGEEGQSDYMQGASTGRRPKITEHDYMATREAKPKYKRVMEQAEDFLLRAIGSGSMADRGTPVWDLRVLLGDDLVPTDNGKELPRPEWDRAIRLARQYVNEHRQLYLGEAHVALDKLVALRTKYEDYFAPGARAKYDVDLTRRTPESPIDENYVRVMARDLLLMAAEKAVNSIAISTTSTTGRIQNNRQAAHFYDQQMKPALERELRTLTGRADLTLEKIALPKALGSPKSERPYTVWAAKLDDSVIETIARDGMPLMAVRDPAAKVSRLDYIKGRVLMRQPVDMSADADRLLQAKSGMPNMLPESIPEMVAVRILPKIGSPSRYIVVARDAQGQEVQFEDDSANMVRSQGMYLNVGGRPAAVLFPFDFGGDLVQSLRGVRAHEAVHGLRVNGFLSGDGRDAGSTWGRLVGHADNLGVLTMSRSELYARMGDSRSETASKEVSTLEVYQELYGNTRHMRELLDQEAVAHMIEVYTHGGWSDQEIGPVKDLLDAILSGDVAQGERQGVHLDMLRSIQDSETGQSMRRDLDSLGFYSKALEAARGLKQEKGTPEQMLAQLKKSGVKDAEIEATGLDKLFRSRQDAPMLPRIKSPAQLGDAFIKAANDHLSDTLSWSDAGRGLADFDEALVDAGLSRREGSDYWLNSAPLTSPLPPSAVRSVRGERFAEFADLPLEVREILAPSGLPEWVNPSDLQALLVDYDPDTVAEDAPAFAQLEWKNAQDVQRRYKSGVKTMLEAKTVDDVFALPNANARAAAFKAWLDANGINYTTDGYLDVASAYFYVDLADKSKVEDPKTVKVRFADHWRQSGNHAAADFNIVSDAEGDRSSGGDEFRRAIAEITKAWRSSPGSLSLEKSGSTTALESDAITLSQNPQQQGDRTASPPRRARLNQITKAEIVKHLEENRVGLREVFYSGHGGRAKLLLERANGNFDAAISAAEAELREATIEARREAGLLLALTGRRARDGSAAFKEIIARDTLESLRRTSSSDFTVAGPTKWSSYSLDPTNPTYRETVLHLPGTPIEKFTVVDHPEHVGNFTLTNERGEYVTGIMGDGVVRPVTLGRDRAWAERTAAERNAHTRPEQDFQSGHFPEPNIIGHMMTSMVKHEGKPVYLIDQIQSDWGQKLRDGGVRDEKKIADISKRIEEIQSRFDADWLRDAGYDLGRAARNADEQLDAGDPTRQAFESLTQSEVSEYDRLRAELATAEASSPGHPLVNTTDQWTQTTLRRAIRQAVEAGAEYIAIPTGDTVLSYNPGDENGMRQFYGSVNTETHIPGIVPKNLRKLLEKIDPAAGKPTYTAKLETPTYGMKGEGFTLFPLTDVVRETVVEEGQPLFAMVSPATDSRPSARDLAKEMTEAIQIITRMTGADAVRVEFMDRITGADDANPAQAAATRRAGFETSTVGGFYQRPTLDARPLIALATNDPAYDLRTTAGHEAFHHVETVLASDAEKRILNHPDEMRRMRALAGAEIGLDAVDPRLAKLPIVEVRAIAYQRYRRMREEGLADASRLHIATRKLWDRITRIFQAIRNALQGRGFDSYESIFERARTGEMARDYAGRQVDTKASVKPAGSVLRNIFDPQMRPDGYVPREPFDLSGVTVASRSTGIVPLDQIKTVQESVSIRAVKAKIANPTTDDGRLPSLFKFDGGYYVNDGNHRIEAARARGARSIRAEVIELAETGSGNVAPPEVLDDGGSLDAQAQPVGLGEDPARGSDADPDVMASLVPAMVKRRIANIYRRTQPMTDAIRIKVQDRVLPIRRVQEAIESATGTRIPLAADIYSAEALYHGRAGERLVDLQSATIEPLIDHLRRSEISMDDLGNYLYARHAQERNAAILAIDPTNRAGSGMTNAEAAQVMSDVFLGGKQAAYDVAAQMIDDMQVSTRDTLLRAGLIDRATYDNWSTQYQHYVPLRGFEAEDSAEMPRNGRGFDIKGPEARRALGRRSVADNPAAYAIQQAMQAIVRAEKNRVDKTLYRAVQAYPDPDLWNVYRGEAKRRVNQSTGLVEVYWVPPAFVNRDDVFGVKIAGKQHWVEIKDPRLARALRGPGGDTNNTLMNAVHKVARTYAQLVTSYNPEFVVSNYLRDIQTALMNVGDIANKPADIRRQIAREAFSFKSIRGVMAALQSHEGRTIFGGRRAADETFTGAKRSAIAQQYATYFNEYRLAGGKISFMEMNDVAQIKADIEKSLSRSRTMRALKDVFKIVENLNASVENGVRLSTYMALRRHGVETDRAAFIARELTVNFNRKGEWGPAINAFYLFFNASMQGTTRLAQALARSKTVQRGVTAIVLFAALMDLANYLGSDDDDDGENAYDKIPDWIKEKNMIFMIPGTRSYLQIPMPYGYNVFYLSGQKAMAVGRSAAGYGKTKPLGAIGNIIGAMAESFSPLGAAPSTAQFIAPTMLDPIIQVGENKSWFGGPIQPQKFNKNKPDSENFFSTVPAWAIDLARFLNKVSGGNAARSGAVDVSPETLEHFTDFAGGGVAKFIGNTWNTIDRTMRGQEWVPEKTPFVRRVYGKATSDSRRRDFYDVWTEVDAARYEFEQARKTRDADRVMDVRKTFATELRSYDAMLSARKQLTIYAKQRDRVNLDRTLGKTEKEAKLKEIQNKENEIILRALAAYNRIKKAKKDTP